MLDIIKSHGAEQVKALGEKFDPALHQAMIQRSEPDKEEDIVLEDFQTGYTLNGRGIRPNKVIVNNSDAAMPNNDFCGINRVMNEALFICVLIS